ncbi:MAG: sigma-70 family RNA polymerase sigma factor [Verrucomicrobiota bacterium]
MVSACRQPGMDQGAIPALKISGGLARAETAAGAWPAEHVNASNQPELSPEELARLSAQGSVASFEQIVLRFQSQVFNFLHVFTRQRQDAEDLTQETFCKAWLGLHRYNPSLSFAPWLFAIARHTAASHFRSAEHFDELPPEAGIVEENPANLLASKDEAEALWRLARTLKPRHWEVLWFRYGEGFSVTETARAMRTNEIHVKVLLHRARARLAKRLAARGYGPAAALKPPEAGTQTVPASEP